MTNQTRQDFLIRTRRLATAFVQASDEFAALAAELTYSGYAAPEGMLGADDFVGENADLTTDGLLAFYATMQALLGPLTADDKRAIYAVRAPISATVPV